jgi:hypothetical protein
MDHNSLNDFIDESPVRAFVFQDGKVNEAPSKWHKSKRNRSHSHFVFTHEQNSQQIVGSFVTSFRFVSDSTPWISLRSTNPGGGLFR